jgi:succinate dehydrogenase / fumarate reductase cytochrome b subunit
LAFNLRGVAVAAAEPSFLVRHEFLIRRLHSLTGIIFGGYVCIHLLTNASILAGAEAFQNNVHRIHGLGAILPVVEWVFIFLPILFHAFVGLAITAGMIPNSQNYPYEANWRYTIQRVTGLYLFLFIFYHVFQTHGWFHFNWWLSIAEPLGGAQFKPYNAASTLAVILQNTVVALLYALGVLAAAFHFFNGLWTAGITWGVWTRPHAQSRVLGICLVAAVLLGGVGLSAIWGARQIADKDNLDEVRAVEDSMYEAKVEAGLLQADDHKRSHVEGEEEMLEIIAEPVSNETSNADRGE